MPYILGSGWVDDPSTIVAPTVTDYVAPAGTDDMGNPIYAGPQLTDPNSAVPVPVIVAVAPQPVSPYESTLLFNSAEQRDAAFHSGEVLQIDFNRFQWGPMNCYAYVPGLGWIINEFWGKREGLKGYSSNYVDLVNNVYRQCRDAQVAANGLFILGSCPTTLGVEVQPWQIHVVNIPPEYANMFSTVPGTGVYQIWGDPNNYMVYQPSIKTWLSESEETAWEQFMGGRGKPWWGISPAVFAGGIVGAAVAVAGSMSTIAVSDYGALYDVALETGESVSGAFPVSQAELTTAANSYATNSFNLPSLSDLPIKATDLIKPAISYGLKFFAGNPVAPKSVAVNQQTVAVNQQTVAPKPYAYNPYGTTIPNPAALTVNNPFYSSVDPGGVIEDTGKSAFGPIMLAILAIKIIGAAHT